MKYTVEKHAGKPAYMQLYTQLREDIVSGALSAGMRLPSKRELASELGIAVLTAEHAYALLAEEGYIESRERRGYFVLYREEPFSPPAVSVPLPESGGRARGEEFPFSLWKKTVRKVLADYEERLLLRSPNSGCAELREAISRYLLRSRGIRAEVGQIIIGSGAEYLYSMIVQLMGRDTVFALEDPSYDKIRRVYEASGVSCELLPLGPDGIGSAALAASRASVLHVTPFHSFPSGVTASAYKRREYIHWAADRGGFVVEDDFDSEFTLSSKAEDTVFALSGGENVIYLNTFSRTIAPSLRVGYMVLPEALTERYRERAGFYSCTVPVFDQLVLAELLESGEFERHINRIRRKRRKNTQIT